jgi:hypothetical protein
VLKWPDKETVTRAASQWAQAQAAIRPGLMRLGYFGSYSRGNWGVGSDLDLVAIVAESDRPFGERPLDWDLTPLPVPADLLVYTPAEWEEVVHRGDRFAQTMSTEVVWLI